ncbi:MAG: hypothetical protein AAFP97_07770 [Pseudomonadota bacterium]
MSDRGSTPAEPVLWDPQSYEAAPQGTHVSAGFNPRQATGTSFGTQAASASHPSPYPAHVEHTAQSGTHRLWSALPQQAAYQDTSHQEPVAAVEPAKSSLMDRFKKRASEDGSVPKSGNRTPFFVGLLTGIVGTLLVGQVFSASTPAPDYSYAPPPVLQSAPDSEPETDSESAVAFLDRVEGLQETSDN